MYVLFLLVEQQKYVITYCIYPVVDKYSSVHRGITSVILCDNAIKQIPKVQGLYRESGE